MDYCTIEWKLDQAYRLTISNFDFISIQTDYDILNQIDQIFHMYPSISKIAFLMFEMNVERMRRLDKWMRNGIRKLNFQVINIDENIETALIDMLGNSKDLVSLSVESICNIENLHRLLAQNATLDPFNTAINEVQQLAKMPQPVIDLIRAFLPFACHLDHLDINHWSTAQLNLIKCHSQNPRNSLKGFTIHDRVKTMAMIDVMPFRISISDLICADFANIHTLRLDGTVISSTSIYDATTLPNLECVSLSHVELDSISWGCLFACLKDAELKRLYLNHVVTRDAPHSSAITVEEVAQILQYNPNMEKLVLNLVCQGSGVDHTDTQVGVSHAIATHPQLRKLKLGGDWYESAAETIGAAIGSNQSLIDLRLGESDRNGVLLQNLSSNKHLIKLDLGVEPITMNVDVALAALIKSSTHLRELAMTIEGFFNVTTRIADAIDGNQSLRALYISGEGACFQGHLIEAALRHLTCFGIIDSLLQNISSGPDMLLVSSIVRNRTDMERLHLKHNSLSDQSLVAIEEMLSLNTSLRFLDLRGNRFSKHCVRELKKLTSVYAHLGSLQLVLSDQEVFESDSDSESNDSMSFLGD